MTTVNTVDQYASSIVEKYRVIPDTSSTSHIAADEVLPVLKQWGKQYLQGLTLSGAYAKNTAITLSSHVDILIALGPLPGMEMKSVFWSLYEYLSDRNLRPRTRDVSIRLQNKKLNVDLIPARRDGAGNLLFNKRTGENVHTDMARHVQLVGSSGRQQEICALKIWRERMAVEFPSLYLELTVLRALEGERFGQLADNVLACCAISLDVLKRRWCAIRLTTKTFCRRTFRRNKKRLSPMRRAMCCMTTTGRRLFGRNGAGWKLPWCGWL